MQVCTRVHVSALFYGLLGTTEMYPLVAPKSRCRQGRILLEDLRETLSRASVFLGLKTRHSSLCLCLPVASSMCLCLRTSVCSQSSDLGFTLIPHYLTLIH